MFNPTGSLHIIMLLVCVIMGFLGVWMCMSVYICIFLLIFLWPFCLFCPVLIFVLFSIILLYFSFYYSFPAYLFSKESQKRASSDGREGGKGSQSVWKDKKIQ